MNCYLISPKYNLPITYLANCARICYGRESEFIVKNLQSRDTWASYDTNIKEQDDLKTVISCYDKGHDRVFECITDLRFYLQNISRSCLAQISTHQMLNGRLTQSQRYCKYDKDEFWQEMVRPSVDYLKYSNVSTQVEIEGTIHEIRKSYEHLLELGVKAEDARCILPNMAPTTMTFSMNLRTFLFSFYPLRSDKNAQKEIQDVTNAMMGCIRREYEDDEMFIKFLDYYKEKKR